MTEQVRNTSRADAFVTYVKDICENPSRKGKRAALKRADNPSTAYQSWDTLAAFGVNLESSSQRLSYSVIAASMARSSDLNENGISLGAALANSYSSKEEVSKPAEARLRRLLSCSDSEELTMIIRPILKLIASKSPKPLDYADLLQQLLWFDADPERQKAKWAIDFYRVALHSLKDNKS